MRILLAILLLLSFSVAAQETYSIPGSAGNVTTLTAGITKLNGDKCAQYGLARTCTQAQICTSAGAPGGASCTNAQARTSGVRIWPLTQAGREEFITFAPGWVSDQFQAFIATQQAESRRVFCAAWTAATTTARNNACSAIGASAGCDPVCQ